MMKKMLRPLRWVGGVTGISLLFVVFFMQWLGHTQAVTLTALNWALPEQFVSISPIVREGNTGVLMVRLSDGAEQFIAGDWQVNFAPSGNVYAFGYFPEGYSQQTGQQVYLIQPGSVSDIAVTGFTGTITSISENTAGTHLLLEVTEDDNVKIYCLAARVDNQSPTCTQINVPDGGLAQWNPLAEHEVVIQNAVGQLLLFDPEQTGEQAGFREVTADDVATYQTLQALFSESKPNVSLFNSIIYQIGNIALVRRPSGWTIVRVPWFARVALLSDQRHLIAISDRTIMVIDPETKQASQLLPNDNVTAVQVNFFDTNP